MHRSLTTTMTAACYHRWRFALVWTGLRAASTSCFHLGTSSYGNQYRFIKNNRGVSNDTPHQIRRQKRRTKPLHQSTTDLDVSQRRLISSHQIHVLSEDPLIHKITDFLSKEECEAYRKRVQELQDSRPMTRSNPPEVSLVTDRLWPLPILSLGAGIPPLLKLLETTTDLSPVTLLSAILPNVALAFAASIILAFVIILPLVRMQSASSSRTSEAMAMNLEEDNDFVHPLVDRICEITGHPWHSWEAPVVTRYDPGAIFARHGDSSPTRGSEWKDHGGQRVVTCICYLNTVPTGGETYFDKLDLAVAPIEGQALVFYPADSTTWKADDRTTHESLPPGEEKMIVQLFGRAERVPGPLGLPDSFGSM
jgi:hypothetical protein